MQPNMLKRISRAGSCIAPLLMVAMLTGCRKEDEYAPPPPPAVTIAHPVQQTIIDHVEFTGSTEAVESVQIRARVEGYLENIRFEDGVRIEKGELLFNIDPKPFQARLDMAAADLSLSLADLELARTTLRRKEGALKDNAISEVEVIEARARRDKAGAAVEAARAAVVTARLDLSYTAIHAPISGRIDRHRADAGNLVGAGERTLLATIVKDDPIHVYFNVSESDLMCYQRQHQQTPTNGNGKTPVFLGVAGEEGYPHEGRVDFVDNRVDADTGTIQVRALFPNPDGLLLPGLFARVRVPTSAPHPALLVPERALGADQLGRFLLVIGDKNTVAYRTVRVGDKFGDLRVIESGIASGDRVIVNGIQRARPGAPVTPVMEDVSKQGAESETAKANEKGGDHD